MNCPVDMDIQKLKTLLGFSFKFRINLFDVNKISLNLYPNEYIIKCTLLKKQSSLING